MIYQKCLSSISILVKIYSPFYAYFAFINEFNYEKANKKPGNPGLVVNY